MFAAGALGPAISVDIEPLDGLASFVTPTMPEMGSVYIALVAPLNATESSVAGWDFMGCEVTPLPA